jgi:hypothetical protein
MISGHSSWNYGQAFWSDYKQKRSYEISREKDENRGRASAEAQTAFSKNPFFL